MNAVAKCLVVAMLGAMVGCASDGGAKPGTIRHSQSFEDGSSIAAFVFSDADAWAHRGEGAGERGGDGGGEDGEGWLELHAQSDYQPPHRSPLNIALLRAPTMGSFELRADMMQTGRDYAHRDMCIFFGFQSPSKYMYAHLGRNADENAHQLFVVDGSPRTPITTSRTDGVDWGQSEWKHVRVFYDEASATVRVYFEDELALESTHIPWSGGLIGFGSFDDEGRVDNIRLTGEIVAVEVDTDFGN